MRSNTVRQDRYLFRKKTLIVIFLLLLIFSLALSHLFAGLMGLLQLDKSMGISDQMQQMMAGIVWQQLWVSLGYAVFFILVLGFSLKFIFFPMETYVFAREEILLNRLKLQFEQERNRKKDLEDITSQMQLDLQVALDRNEILPHYQPIIDLQSGKIVGAEALMRWWKEEAFVSPELFISEMEESHLLTEVQQRMLACMYADMQRWPDLDRDFYLSFNVSPRLLRSNGLIEWLQPCLQLARKKHIQLALEFTEMSLMEEAEHVIAVLNQLKSEGVKIFIDDFGTGYSAFSYLKDLPVSTLKVDKAFTDGLPGDSSVVAIVDAIIRLAKTLNLLVVAEGVETQAQADALRDMNCDYVQGFLFYKPMDAGTFYKTYQNKGAAQSSI